MATIPEALAMAMQAMQGGHLAQSEDICRRILQAAPNTSDAHWILGYVCQSLGKLDDAVASYREVLRVKPGLAEVHNNLGNILRDQGDLKGSEACLREAIRLKPDYANAHHNLGNTLKDIGGLEESAQHFQEALRLRPDHSEARNGLGAALAAQGKLEEAIGHYQQAIQANPPYAAAHMNLGMAWLLKGDLERGWPEYEWRWPCNNLVKPAYAQSPWDGSPLNGRVLYLYTEQGLGDALQFVRFATLAKEQGGSIILECPPPLVRLFQRCKGIDFVQARSPLPPAFDVHAPLLSVPGLLGISLATLPAEVPYLFPEETLVASWREELSRTPGFKVGLAWQGNPTHQGDRHRSLQLAAFAALAKLEGVQLYSLQKGKGSEQVGTLPIVDLAARMGDDFMETAAIVKNLDLVISVDTAVTHLAGGLGVPVWTLLPYSPDWRWLLGREDSPWYPTMRLFRQPAVGDWNAVMARVREEVREAQRSAARRG